MCHGNMRMRCLICVLVAVMLASFLHVMESWLHVMGVSASCVSVSRDGCLGFM